MGTQLFSPKSGGNQTGEGGGGTGGKQTFQQKIKSYLQDRFDTCSLEKLEKSINTKVEKVLYGGCFLPNAALYTFAFHFASVF